MTSTSVHQKFSGLLIVIGSLVFVCGGAFHPRINSSLGALGSTEFFQNFYMHIAHHGSLCRMEFGSLPSQQQRVRRPYIRAAGCCSRKLFDSKRPEAHS